MKLLTLIILAAWLLALFRTILNLRAIPKLEPRLLTDPPLVSIIVPARDEERSIGATVRAFLDQTYAPLEVIVVDDRSSDATGSILASLAATDQRLTVVGGEEMPVGWLGKPWALHQGGLRARGELLLFVDADIHYEPDAVSAAVSRILETGAGLLSLLPRVVMRGFWEHVAMPNLATLFFSGLPVWLTNNSRRFPIFAIGGGPGNLIRRSVYDEVGGHAALKNAVVDDIALPRLTRRAGHATEVARADHLVSVRMYHGAGEIISGFTKNVFPALGRSYVIVAFAIVAVGLLNVLPYVLAARGNGLAILTVGLILLTRLILYVTLRYGVLNALLGHLPMLLIWGWITARSIWFTGIRKRLLWRGRNYDAGGTRFGDEG